MSQGLITRIGLWLDKRWESKATESEMLSRFNSLENAAISDKLELKDLIIRLSAKLDSDMIAVEKKLSDLQAPSGKEKEIADLKTRIEKMELYSGMTRKADPTKPPVVKSAFAM